MKCGGPGEGSCSEAEVPEGRHALKIVRRYSEGRERVKKRGGFKLQWSCAAPMMWLTN